ncbi:L,D-transpeptidase [Shinella fusca]|jgi:lipoprotein-anchoring transpeptidase ErfK/SrfK|uniref:Lipoprotein-anchoring transpeptidase ErfK/SrfK n=1 Tax=Shinella fusca TaxID=544480 RepID=A0A7W7YWE4_9HYPH|nr:L,D-transpeptidase [Shinella fusca]MBB5043377.1 lipoprotein-anchoring transpeptidase ErfK/SrfK [Shinella fusca]
MSISRRGFLLGASAALLAGCATNGMGGRADYGARPDEKHPLKAMPLDKIKPELRRQEVAYETGQAAGTIVVDTPARRLYYVLGEGRAIRYGIGVGRMGYSLAGNATVGRKAEWPSWTPTPNMMRRDRRNLKYAGGLPGGINNPLGARAMYLYQNGRDTMFRIHGTNQPWSIGQAMSSGCVRMLNHDVIDLYARVEPGTHVFVVQGRREA